MMLVNKAKDKCRSSKNIIISFYSLVVIVLTLQSINIEILSLSHYLLSLFLGYFVWSITEYGLHRFTFHYNPKNFAWSYLTYGLHVYHHKNPDKKEYIPVPIRLSLPIFCLISAAIIMISSKTAFGLMMSAGFGASYILFEHYHYSSHDNNKMDFITKKIRKYHNHHHNISSKKNYGVLCPFWDLAFNTSTWKDSSNGK